jgi:alkylated DNA repair dioxygenase AlkB
MELFKKTEDRLDLNLPDANISYVPHFLRPDFANLAFDIFLDELDWRQHHIKIFGKLLPQPRLSALYGINDQSYTYSNLTLKPLKFTPKLLEIHQKLKELTKINFTHCLANLYRDGNDSMGWHADDEKELGENPVIASVSLGAARRFQLKHKSDSNLKAQLDLEHGSLLLMKGTTQHFWKHQLSKTKKPVSPRINLTFRTLF